MAFAGSTTSAAPTQHAASPHHGHGNKTLVALALIALGVVYGDIGTSPLYAFQVALSATGEVLPARETVLGIVGLILYAILFTVTFKYVTIVLKADNQGEGGILALLGLVKSNRYSRGIRIPGLVTLAIIGAAFIYGDGTITPAVSVLSAMEGIKVVAPSFEHFIMPATLLILIALFAVQHKGTAEIGRLFGPVMLVWFFALGAIGLIQTLLHPSILMAISPHYAIAVLMKSPGISMAIFGAVFLALTGGEALYADMAHVNGAAAIRAAWYFVVLPALTLSYLGQGASVLADPATADAPFWKAIPHFMVIPVLLLATLATIIASQALITGAFSLTRQAIQMGLMPRMRIVQTSGDEHGQIYVPTVNWLLMAATLVVVVTFKTSEALASAYGIAVSGTMLITTILLYRVMVEKWRWNQVFALGLSLVFAAVDLAFLAANSAKFFEGGYFPLFLGGTIAFVMISWARGAQEVKKSLVEMSVPLDDFIACVDDGHIARVPGTAVWLTKVSSGITPTLQQHVRHVKALHETVVLLTIETARVPYVGDHSWLTTEDLGHGFIRVIMRSGFMQQPQVEAALRGLSLRHVAEIDRHDTHYFIGHEIPARKASGSCLCFGSWLAFQMMSKLNGKAADYFHLPQVKVEEVGVRIEI